jgi:hypothetical protein
VLNRLPGSAANVGHASVFGKLFVDSFFCRILMSGQQTPRRWGLGNPAEETICCPNALFIPEHDSFSKKKLT